MSRPARPPAERFWPKVDVRGPEECWPWTAYKDKLGYGTFGGVGCRTIRAYRFAYELLVGPIPEGLVIDHLCRNPACVNPAHMEAVTQGENVRRGNAGGYRGPQPKKERCKWGHPLSGDNLYVTPKGRRTCRACARLRTRAWATAVGNARRRAKRQAMGKLKPAARPVRPRPQRQTCKRGHPLTGANLYVSPKGDRRCRTCHNDRMRAYLPGYREINGR